MHYNKQVAGSKHAGVQTCLFEFLHVMILTDSVTVSTVTVGIKTASGPGMACATVRELRIDFLHHTHC